MRIENQSRAGSAPAAARVSRPAKTGSFQDALIARSAEYRQDTLTISATAAQTKTASMNVSQTADASTILPTDSVSVKLEKLQKIAETADYTDMSYSEIAATIWKRYNEAFDGNMAALSSGFIGGYERDSITHQFVKEVDDSVYHPLYRKIEAETGLRYGEAAFQEYWNEHYKNQLGAATLSYGGMSSEEMEKAILEKYAGKNTFCDFAGMMYELRQSGVLDDKLGHDAVVHSWGLLTRELQDKYPPESYDGHIFDNRWDSTIHQPFNFQSFAQELKDTIQKLSFCNYDFDIRNTLFQSVDKLLALFDSKIQ